MAVGLALPGSRNDCRAFTESGIDRACCGVPTIADGGYQGTGLLEVFNGWGYGGETIDGRAGATALAN